MNQQTAKTPLSQIKDTFALYLTRNQGFVFNPPQTFEDEKQFLDDTSNFVQSLNDLGEPFFSVILQVKFDGTSSDTTLENHIHLVRILIAGLFLGRNIEQLKEIWTPPIISLTVAFMTFTFKKIHESEDDLINIINAQYKEELLHKIDFSGTHVATALFFSPFNSPYLCKIKNIPDFIFSEYITYLLPSSAMYVDHWKQGKTTRYLEKIVDETYTILRDTRWITNNNDNAVTLLNYIFYQASFISGYFLDQPMIKLFTQRGELFQLALELQGMESDFNFPPRNPNEKIRVGFLSHHFTPQTETYVTLPSFKYLDRDRYEVLLFSEIITNKDALENQCRLHSDLMIPLEKDVKRDVDTIRKYNLDILIISNNITASNSRISQLALFKLARHTAITSCCPTTTGYKHIDYYISGRYTEPSSGSEYNEKCLLMDGPAHAFDFGSDAHHIQETVNTAAQQNQDITFFASGANYFKLSEELIETWAEILQKTPDSILVLFPFNPNWSKSYPKKVAKENIEAVFSRCNLTMDRLRIIEPLPNRTDILNLLSVADVYLDSFPYSGATSLIDPLQCGVPVVAMTGKTARCRQAYAILRCLGLTELAPESKEAYIAIASELGNNRELRKKTKEIIREQMNKSPKFMDGRWLSGEMERLFLEMLRY